MSMYQTARSLAIITAAAACARRPAPRSHNALAASDTSISQLTLASRGGGGGVLAALHDSLDWLKPHAGTFTIEGLRRDYRFNGYFAIVRLTGKGFGTNPTTASGDVYAVVRLDSTLTRMTGLVDTFPTRRGGDYDVWFQPATASNPLIVCGQGASYGDQKMRRTIYFDASGIRTDSVRVGGDVSPSEWSSERGCGISGYVND